MPTIQIDMDEVNSVTFDSNTVNAIYLNSTKIWEVAQPSTLIAYATAQPGVTYTEITSLTNYTDEEVNAISKAISNCQDITSSTQTIYLSDETSISINATRNCTLSTEEVITSRIIGFNHDDLTSSTAYGEATATGKAGITWQTAQCLSTLYKMNTSGGNAGGWNGSLMRTTTLPTIKLTMPQSLQNIIKFVDKKAANGGSGNFSAVVISSDDLFLLSEIEIFGADGTYYAQRASSEGTQYAWWVPKTTGNDRIKYYDNNGNWTSTIWWERSSAYNSTSNFACVSAMGLVSSQSGTGSARGVAFAYCT